MHACMHVYFMYECMYVIMQHIHATSTNISDAIFVREYMRIHVNMIMKVSSWKSIYVHECIHARVLSCSCDSHANLRMHPCVCELLHLLERMCVYTCIFMCKYAYTNLNTVQDF